MSLIEEAQTQIGGAKQALEPAAEGVATAHETVEKLVAGSQSAGWDEKAQRAGSISDALGDLHAVLTDATSTLGEVTMALEALKGLVRGGSTTGIGASPGPRRFDAAAFDPEHATAIRRFGWPKNQQGRTKARGVAYGPDGRSVLRQPLKALSGNKVYNTPDLKDAWRSRDIATSWHIEGGIAAHMRRTGTREVALWLNVPPCGGRGRPDPAGCDENLAKILPRGYTLHVHVVDERGNYTYLPYRGTGEALKTNE